ncbi:MAG TPA: BON domain-containing protein [Planctomycetaceae bacterium]|nr:BON domain-containing protein [Planctomycetaceae bacterium]
MAGSSILSPLLEQFRGDAKADFCYASARPMPCWAGSAADDADLQLEDELHHALSATGYSTLRHIGVDHGSGHVVLWGRVPTYFLKQLAHSIAASFPGVQFVDNNIEVAGPG